LCHRRRDLDEVFVKINGAKHYLWRAVDQTVRSLSALAPSGGTSSTPENKDKAIFSDSDRT
jgi:hypothetical protein